MKTYIQIQIDSDETIIINIFAIESIIAVPRGEKIMCTVSMFSGDAYEISEETFERIRKHLHVQGLAVDIEYFYEDDAWADYVVLETHNGKAIVNISAMESLAKVGGHVVLHLLSQDYVTVSSEVGKKLEAYLYSAHGITDLRQGGNDE